MDSRIQLLKEKISKLSEKETFIHYKWFLKYHLELVEKISLELYVKYAMADLDLLLGLVWIHDYGKIVGITDMNEILEKSRSFLLEIGFENEYVNRLVRLLEIFESKMSIDLTQAPMEVRIISTADAVSHMYGPFYQIYCYENPEMSVEELMESNMRKLEKDWNRKIAFPEIKDKLKDRFAFLKESFGFIEEPILK